MITSADIASKVDTAVKANGIEHAKGIDIDGIVSEIVETYGLVDIDATDEEGEPVIPFDDFWAIVARHDATQQAETVTLANEEDARSLAALIGQNGASAAFNGRTVTVDAAALAVLADLDAEHDGHFDGTYIWVGGSEYRVSP